MNDMKKDRQRPPKRCSAQNAQPPKRHAVQNALFVGTVVAVFLFFAIGAPLRMILVKRGVLPYADAGNEVAVERAFADGALLSPVYNGAESLKRDIKDAVINYLPHFDGVLTEVKNLEKKINAPTEKYLDDLSVRIFLEKVNAKY